MPIIEKRAVDSVDKIIAVSEFTKKQIAQYYDVKLDKIEVIYNGFDKDDLISFNEDYLAKFKNDNFPNKKILLFVGRVDDYRKGLDILLYVFRDILDSLNAVLIVLGGGNSKKSVELCKELGISDYVIFMGRVDKYTLLEYYKLCDVYICPSRLEGFGLTILEAMAAGKPVVGSKNSAIPEIIKDHINGILVDSENPIEMANAIFECLKWKNLEYIKNFNQNYLKENFSWINNAKKLLEVYINLCDE